MYENWRVGKFKTGRISLRSPKDENIKAVYSISKTSYTFSDEAPSTALTAKDARKSSATRSSEVQTGKWIFYYLSITHLI